MKSGNLIDAVLSIRFVGTIRQRSHVGPPGGGISKVSERFLMEDACSTRVSSA
jgi:hypothetical protein